jgi:uncharacterized protein (TIGR02594 family)
LYRRDLLFGISSLITTTILPHQSYAKISFAEKRIRSKVLINAQELMGLYERNPKHREFLKQYFDTYIGKPVDPVRTPWCAAYVDAVLGASGLPILNSLWARDFLKYGKSVEDPVQGDIAVFSRKKNYGHVGFYIAMTDNYVQIFNGNAEGRVKISNYPKHRLLGFQSYIS